jgi:hypothetical protein
MSTASFTGLRCYMTMDLLDFHFESTTAGMGGYLPPTCVGSSGFSSSSMQLHTHTTCSRTHNADELSPPSAAIARPTPASDASSAFTKARSIAHCTPAHARSCARSPPTTADHVYARLPPLSPTVAAQPDVHARTTAPQGPTPRSRPWVRTIFNACITS